MSIQSNQLEYAPPDPRQRRRRIARWFQIGAVACVIAWLLAAAAARLWMTVPVYYWQQQCMNYTAPP